MAYRGDVPRRGLPVLLAAATTVIAACGGPAPRLTGTQRTGSAPTPPIASTTGAPRPTAAARPSAAPPTPGPSAGRARYAFPVRGKASYGRDHHDYPATDIMAACGAVVVSVVNGVVLEVNRVDTYQPTVDAGSTRGGLSVSILGDDGVRYYGSHLSVINPGIRAGGPITAGQPLGKVGATGHASACHLHFGISPPCAKTGDWWVRRGVVWPWPYLDSWRSGGARSPVDAVAAWRARNGCPTRPTAGR